MCKQETEFFRNCPECDKKMYYKNDNTKLKAINNNTKCLSCVRKNFHKNNPDFISGKNNPMHGKSIEILLIEKYGADEAVKKMQIRNNKISKSNTGENNGMYESGEDNPMYGKSLYSVWLENYGKEIADEKYLNWTKNMCGRLSPMKNKHHTKEAKRKIRTKFLKYKENNNQLFVNCNKDACEIVDWINKFYNFNFKHADNGGEYHIKELGYFLDAYDNKNNIVIEYYERAHYKKDGTLKERDLIREQEIIEHLNCEFVRINAFNKHNLILEKIN